MLCEENEIGEAFYIIISGEITLTKNSSDGSSIKVCILGRGSLFGEEIAINSSETYEYNAIVTTISASVMEIKKEDFFQKFPQECKDQIIADYLIKQKSRKKITDLNVTNVSRRIQMVTASDN